MTTKRTASDVFRDLINRAAEVEAIFSAIENMAYNNTEGRSIEYAAFLATVGQRLADSIGAIADYAAIGRFDEWTTEFSPPDKKKAVAASA